MGVDPEGEATMASAPSVSYSITVRLELPADPAPAAQPSCVGGEVGIMRSGVLIVTS